MSSERPKKRRISFKVLTYAVGGPEKPVPVYEFSRGKTRYERPKHNPFV